MNFNDVEACVDALLSRVGKHIVLGLPLGIGKPNRFVNALYRRARNDSSIQLKIFTALTPRVPGARGLLGQRFFEPIRHRLYGSYESLDYGRDVHARKLPPNVEVAEFYFAPGAYLGSPYAQQQHVSANYSHVVRALVERGVNVVAHAVAKRGEAEQAKYSVGSNPDLTFDLLRDLGPERRPFLVGQVASSMPFMANHAETPADFWDAIVDDSALREGSTLFCVPNKPVELVDYAIATHVTSMIADAGTLQIGIGSLADAVTHLIRMRHTQNNEFKRLVERLVGDPERNERNKLPVETAPFEQGLYGCSEMLVEGFLHLIDAGVLKRRVADESHPERGVLLHAAFFLGTNAFYERLRSLTDDEQAGISMRGVRFVNTLDDDFETKSRQRSAARFINSAMMVTLDGACVSDALRGKRVVSGVGGQHDFIQMAQRLPDARSIIMLPSTRTKAGRAASNIVFEYPHTTIPRQFRDIVVTEYGIADLRGMSDCDVMTRLLNVTDSRFQADLLARAKAAGKVDSSYQIPAAFRENLPEKLESRLTSDLLDKLPHFPLSSDFSEVEARLAVALSFLKPIADSRTELLGLLTSPAGRRDDWRHELERMGLAEARGLKERINRRLLCAALAKRRDSRPLFGQ